ncbi:MAG: RNA polymerase sigma-70 factor [Prevotella sp.]|nr:RNA polymerase sigma-70 factor [Prevotella sp.]
MSHPPTKLSEDDCRRWNASTFRKLYKLYYKALVIYALRILQDENEAEDTVQELFAHLWEHDTRFDNEVQLRAYLYRSVRNLCIKRLRHLKVVNGYATDCLSTPRETDGKDLNDQLEVEEVYRQLLLTVERMPQRQREVFEMYMDGMSNTEIAEAMRISAETVKTQKHRALRHLREQLGDSQFSLITIFIV